ncbi:hypothetical protein HPB50_009103 [Hyalomma asiaticum]|uniref:Uncharacterized protein n=1 Tax=Hyalomma asiaticum TaxID=266040 RepID=A0ACB7T4E8_HYAAI|nr:hypothetical protein HPB50_009103 [Hyalomma asiaticum]
MASLKQCKSLTLERKVALIKEVEKGGRTKSSIAQEFGIPLSTLSTVLKNEQKVLDGFQQSFSSQRKRLRGSKFPDTEACLPKQRQYSNHVTFIGRYSRKLKFMDGVSSRRPCPSAAVFVVATPDGRVKDTPAAIAAVKAGSATSAVATA